jgi:nucleoside-diphosphate-sugar epimerase
MNVLVTGNLGYIGTVLTDVLKRTGYNVVGYDIGYYSGFEVGGYMMPDKQVTKDIRDISEGDFRDVDAVVHLAALSNDPLGEFHPELTEEINLKGTLRAANAAKGAGVSRFVYSSSQSMYGISELDEELDEDDSKKNPLTVYARTKWEAECALRDLNSNNFVVSYFRPSTVFGASPKLRCDIVYNNLVACAYSTGKIEVKSDGTPWRPVVHVQDVCRAYVAGLVAPSRLVANQAFNVGIPNGNFTVRELAEAAQKVVPGSVLTFLGEHNDSRTYRVGFKKILAVLKDYFKPEWDLHKGGLELVSFFRQIGFTENDFRGRHCNRLPQLKGLLSESIIDDNLRMRFL